MAKLYLPRINKILKKKKKKNVCMYICMYVYCGLVQIEWIDTSRA